MGGRKSREGEIKSRWISMKEVETAGIGGGMVKPAGASWEKKPGS